MKINNYNQFITEARSKPSTIETLNFKEAYDLIIGGDLKVIEIKPRIGDSNFRICYRNNPNNFRKTPLGGYKTCDCILVPFENDQEKEKILQTFKKDDNSKVLEDIEDICLDLKSEYFDVKVVDRSYRNDGHIYVGITKDPTGNITVEFELVEIFETIQQIIDYMKFEGFILDDIYCFDLVHTIDLSKDNLESWDKSKQVLGLDLYFD